MTFRYRRLPNVGRIKSRATDVQSESISVFNAIRLLWTRKGTKTIEERTPRSFAFWSSREDPSQAKIDRRPQRRKYRSPGAERRRGEEIAWERD